MIDFGYTLGKLYENLHLFLGGLAVVFLLTPMIGKFARKLNAIDIPVEDRGRNKSKGEVEDPMKYKPRLGGLAFVSVFIILMFISIGFTAFTISVGLALLVLIIAGVLDDIKDLSGAKQLVFQIFAVLIIIFSGTRILSVDIFGFYSNFNQFSYVLPILNGAISFVFPADIITLLWFLVIINAMNWVAGIDALEETMAWIAGFTLLLLAIKFGREDMIALSSIFNGVVIGFWMYNYPPSKILAGTIGNTALGFLLALFSIKIDGKMTTSILLLALPLVDFVWVLVKRLIKYREFNPLKLMAISGQHHLHHRLMELGYSNKQVLFIEISIFSLFAVLAYYFAGFNIFAVAVLGSFSLLMFFFAILTYKRAKRKRVVDGGDSDGSGGNIKQAEIKQSPESVYAY